LISPHCASLIMVCGLLAAVVWAAWLVARGEPGGAQRSRPSAAHPAARALAARHPGCRRRVTEAVPGAPADGEPLTDCERRVLGRIEMDACIRVPEVVYHPGAP
jgi:hypothetical protein